MLKYSWVLIVSLCYSQSGPPKHNYFLNPGMKLGYAFGENGGFTYGFELSFVVTSRDSKHPSRGITLNYDFISKGSRVHLGFEYLSPFIGIDVGPTMYTTQSTNNFGFSVIPFIGIFIIPYYNFTYINSDGTFNEIGSYIKIPIQTDHYRYNWQNSN